MPQGSPKQCQTHTLQVLSWPAPHEVPLTAANPTSPLRAPSPQFLSDRSHPPGRGRGGPPCSGPCLLASTLQQSPACGQSSGWVRERLGRCRQPAELPGGSWDVPLHRGRESRGPSTPSGWRTQGHCREERHRQGQWVCPGAGGRGQQINSSIQQVPSERPVCAEPAGGTSHKEGKDMLLHLKSAQSRRGTKHATGNKERAKAKEQVL